MNLIDISDLQPFPSIQDGKAEISIAQMKCHQNPMNRRQMSIR